MVELDGYLTRLAAAQLLTEEKLRDVWAKLASFIDSLNQGGLQFMVDGKASSFGVPSTLTQGVNATVRRNASSSLVKKDHDG
jgi:hypothetical protein